MKKNILKVATVLFSLMMIVNLSFAQDKKVSNNEVIKIKTSSQCGMCKETIEKAMAYEKGVKSSDLDVKTKVLTVTYNPVKTTPEKIRLAVSKVGYDADDVKADVKAYNKLSPCCKKDGHK